MMLGSMKSLFILCLLVIYSIFLLVCAFNNQDKYLAILDFYHFLKISLFSLSFFDKLTFAEILSCQ